MDTLHAVALLVLVGLVAVLVGLPGIVVIAAVFLTVVAWALPLWRRRPRR
jgi:hypothetical protein